MPVLPSSDRGTTGGSRLMFATSYDEAKASIDAGSESSYRRQICGFPGKWILPGKLAGLIPDLTRVPLPGSSQALRAVVVVAEY